MVGHNFNKGLLFSSPFITSNAAYTSYLQTSFPDASPSVMNYIENTLYPPIFNGSYRYTNQVERGAATVTDAQFSCNAAYLSQAFANRTYAYLFSVPPGLHGLDVPYTFFNGPTFSVLNNTLAYVLQDYITSFAMKGVPSAAGGPTFPLYGEAATLLNLNVSSITPEMDPASNDRCVWWQKGLIYQ